MVSPSPNPDISLAFPSLAKAVNIFCFGFTHAGSGILYPEAKLSVPVFGIQVDVTFVCKLEGIAEKIIHYLL